jgi:hypothetical protein
MTNRLRTTAEVERLRARHDRPEFADAWAALLARADTALAQRLRPVGLAAGWGHGYYCPDHVVPLDFDPDAPTVHRCPVDGVVWEGPVFDGGWRCALNSRILDGIEAAGSVWQATGDTRYRDHVVDILLDYADRYPGLPPYGHHVGKGRVTGQSLEEAVWGIGIARAFDRVRDSLDPGDAKSIESNLLSEIGRHVTDQLMGKIHNIECWHLASLATIGVVLDDADLLALAMDGEFSLPAQLREGILEDGWWAEGSPSYHFYMLASVLNAAIALRERVPEFLATPGLRDMFTTPLAMMRADFSLPAFNDGWNSISMPLGMAQYVQLYEQGFGLWHGQAEEDFLRSVYARGIERTSEAALTMGPDLTRAVPAHEWTRRTVHPASGYAILSDGPATDESYLLLKYGPHGGGHGHPDKLELDLHAFGVRLAPDAGSPAYISPLQGPWVRQTLSHNTVLLDEESQPPAQGRLRGYLDPRSNAVGVVDAEVSWPVDPDEPNGRPGSWAEGAAGVVPARLRRCCDATDRGVEERTGRVLPRHRPRGHARRRPGRPRLASPRRARLPRAGRPRRRGMGVAERDVRVPRRRRAPAQRRGEPTRVVGGLGGGRRRVPDVGAGSGRHHHAGRDVTVEPAGRAAVDRAAAVERDRCGVRGCGRTRTWRSADVAGRALGPVGPRRVPGRRAASRRHACDGPGHLGRRARCARVNGDGDHGTGRRRRELPCHAAELTGPRRPRVRKSTSGGQGEVELRTPDGR